MITSGHCNQVAVAHSYWRKPLFRARRYLLCKLQLCEEGKCPFWECNSYFGSYEITCILNIAKMHYYIRGVCPVNRFLR